MNNTIPTIAARCLAKVLRLSPAQAESLDPDDDLFVGHGMTSLDMVLFMTSMCEACGVPLTRLDENDLAETKTLRDAAQLLTAKQHDMEHEYALGTPR
jgi:aryl carrier-like protein